MSHNGRTRRRRGLAYAALFGAVAVCCLVSNGQAEDNQSLCSSDRLGTDARIAACTAVILSGGGIHSDLAWAYNNRGADYVRDSAYDKALRDLDQAIRLKPDYIAALNNRCYLLAVLDRANDAIADCNRSLQLMPTNYRALDSRGFAHLRAGRPEKALADYNAALAINAKVAASLYGRGRAHQKLGHNAAALADLENARRLDAGIDTAMAKIGLAP